jgi:hypothetical protein
MVWAVGKPELEEGEVCFFDKIFNAVVFGCRGKQLLRHLIGRAQHEKDIVGPSQTTLVEGI